MILFNSARIHARNRFALNRYQRIACSRPADHVSTQLLSLCKISATLIVKKFPEASDVLFQLPYDQIGPVSRQILFRGRIFRIEQSSRGSLGVEQRPICYFSVLVTITEQELTEQGFSQTAIENFFGPFFGGVFLQPKLTTSSRFFHYVFRMFADGSAAVPKQGMGQIPQQLAARRAELDLQGQRDPLA